MFSSLVEGEENYCFILSSQLVVVVFSVKLFESQLKVTNISKTLVARLIEK